MFKRLRLPAFAFFLVFILALSAMAEQNVGRIYLPMSVADSKELIGSPPAPDSEEHRTQMAIVLWLQKTRTPQQVAFVEKPLNLERFAPFINTDLVNADGRLLNTTLDAIINEVRANYDALKAIYGEPRPFQADKRVHPVGDPRPVASYPSGHATRAMVYGKILSDLFPKHSDDLMALAVQIGYGRVIAGVHYPKDVIAGQTLGAAYADAILAQPTYAEAKRKILGSD
ncbi:phosphatase PAP2 family protein [Hoeflea sp. CAU 1731]